ncbi:MAG: replication protein [Oscillospiraceae bacterium]|nr:replication protein [Oscillospiraceae bacterium]
MLTFNNPADHGVTRENIKASLAMIPSLGYWCMCEETGGKSGTPHIHVFVYRYSPILFDRLKELFPSAHLDNCRGTCEQNRDYILKQGKHSDTDKSATSHPDTFEESGRCPGQQQGKRTDLETLVKLIQDGVSTIDIIKFNPNYARYFDKIERTRQLFIEDKYKNTFRQIVVEYWYGDTGTGKTRTVMEQYGYENVYRVTNYKNPFDRYKGQDVLLLDEFRSDLKIGELLEYLQGYPLSLPCRFHDRVACYTKVYIISNIALDEQYPNIQREQKKTWEAFLRRINTVRHFGKNGIDKCGTPYEFLYGSSKEDDDGFISLDDISIDDNPFFTSA